MFIRVYENNKEILINLDFASKIEVMYVKPDPSDPNKDFEVSHKLAATDIDVRRYYKVFVGGKDYLLGTDPSDSVGRILEDIYLKAIKT